MASKIWDSASWKEYKNLRIYNGSAWKDAAKGWLWNGSVWKQFYPEYPIVTTAPTVSGSTTQGNLLSVTTGTWRGFPNDKAFAYTSVSYQWLRNGSDISGATASQYSTVVADVGSAISCRVTALNNRGTTPSTTSNSLTIQSALPGAPSNLSVTSSTITPGIFAVSSSSAAVVPTITMGSNTNVTSSAATINWTSTNQSSWQVSGSFSASGTSETSYTASTSASSSYSGSVVVKGAGSTSASGSWTLPTNLSYYTYSTNTGALSADPTNRTFSLTGSTSGAYYVVDVTAWNSSGRATISWTAGANATSYDIYVNGSLWQSSYVGTSAVYNWGSTGTLNVTVRSRNSQGVETTGVSSSGTISQAGLTAQTSGYINSGNTASGSYSVSTPAASVIPTFTTAATVSNIINTGGTLSWASTNQNSYSISAPGTALDGATGAFATQRTFTGLTAGATYSYTVTITSSTGHTATSSGSFTTTGGGVAPGTPTGATVTGSGYVSWGASTGSVATYEIQFYTATDSAGSNRGGPYFVLSIPGNQTYYQLTSSDGYASPNNYVRIQVRSRNSSGVSTYGTWDPSATTYR